MNFLDLLGSEHYLLLTERKVGDAYDPDCLPDHRGPYFAHQESKLIQRDYKDVDGDLIAPQEVYGKLTEGTLFSAQITLHTYIWDGNQGFPRNKVCLSRDYLILPTDPLSRSITSTSRGSRSSTKGMPKRGIHLFPSCPPPPRRVPLKSVAVLSATTTQIVRLMLLTLFHLPKKPASNDIHP